MLSEPFRAETPPHPILRIRYRRATPLEFVSPISQQKLECSQTSIQLQRSLRGEDGGPARGMVH